MVVNCRSVKNKVEELSGLILSVKADIILGTESWLDDSISHHEVSPRCINVYRKDRSLHGGRVFLLVNNHLLNYQLNIAENNVESVWCRVRLHDNTYFTVAVFHRPPNSEILLP
ncbi:unnamed protein product [Ixodes hexagonus]